MISFIISLAALIAGYFIYGRIIEKVFAPDINRPTPAASKADGMDYIQMPNWKVFMIQFLNIAGTGPIFGAIMGAKFGPSSYLWIVLGCIFAGAVHDYLCGMLSIRNGGVGLPELVGIYLGKNVKKVMLVFSILLLLLVGTVFVYSPALILGNMTGGTQTAIMIWVLGIFLYYIVATLLPIDKVIGRIYPVFAISMLIMAAALAACLFIKWPSLPEIWDGLGNRTSAETPIFPCLFITIACGAISGFHGTQSPMMARCIANEKYGRPIFYGSMITEGIVALIWAAVSSYFFFEGGAAEVGASTSAAAPTVVTAVSSGWLGTIGGLLAILGVVAAPITSGDTAFRSSRMILADFFHLDQHPIQNRLLLAVPLFVIAGALLWFNIANEDGFNIIWRYFGWANQTLACFTLWAATVFLFHKNNFSHLFTLIPACFMTSVCVSYICIAKIGLNLPSSWSPWIGLSTFCLSFVLWIVLSGRARKEHIHSETEKTE